jgi:hypothetical protein
MRACSGAPTAFISEKIRPCVVVWVRSARATGWFSLMLLSHLLWHGSCFFRPRHRLFQGFPYVDSAYASCCFSPLMMRHEAYNPCCLRGHGLTCSSWCARNSEASPTDSLASERGSSWSGKKQPHAIRVRFAVFCQVFCALACTPNLPPYPSFFAQQLLDREEGIQKGFGTDGQKACPNCRKGITCASNFCSLSLRRLESEGFPHRGSSKPGMFHWSARKTKNTW